MDLVKQWNGTAIPLSLFTQSMDEPDYGQVPAAWWR